MVAGSKNWKGQYVIVDIEQNLATSTVPFFTTVLSKLPGITEIGSTTPRFTTPVHDVGELDYNLAAYNLCSNVLLITISILLQHQHCATVSGQPSPSTITFEHFNSMAKLDDNSTLKRGRVRGRRNTMAAVDSDADCCARRDPLPMTQKPRNLDARTDYQMPAMRL